jgi:RND family efflux transporter MFP subunit
MFYSRHAVALLSISCSSLALTGCNPTHDDDPRTQPALVRTATVQPPAKAARSFTGVVVARVQSELGFRVPGKIVTRLVDTGQAVKRGQPLMRIDPEDLLLATRARDEAVAAATARERQAVAEEKRYQGLVVAGAVSASAYDQARAAAETAKAELQAARANARVAGNALGYAVLLADADGVVVDTLAEPGQVVAAGQAVVRIAHAGAREARIDLPETLRPAVGDKAQARLYGVQGEYAATLRQLSSSADGLTRTYEARYVLSGSLAQAPLGATVTVAIADAAAAPGLQVPLAALYDNGKGPGVWVVQDKAHPVVRWRAVQLERLASETATLKAGLQPGERFVALGAHMLSEGAPVRVAASEGAAQ